VTAARLRSWPPAGLSRTATRLADELRIHGPSTRARLGELTGLSRPTVSTALAELADRDLLATHTRNDGQVLGRPAELVRLNRNAGLAIGIDIGRRHVQVVLADLGHQKIGKLPAETDAYRHPPSADAHPDHVLDKAAALVHEVLDRTGNNLRHVAAIGLGVPAPITHSGQIGSPTLLPGWAGIHPAPALAARLDDTPVLVDNDANLGALGEYLFGGFRDEYRTTGHYEMTYIKIATGIGAGIIRDGQLRYGASGIAGELGHIPLDHKDPQTCLCGGHGCLELYAGGEALLKKARIGWPQLTDTLELVDRAKAGDPYCISVIKDAGDHIGTALGTLVNLNGPHQIVIGGELSDSGEILLGPIRERITRTAMPPAASGVTITEARLKKWSSASGAVALVLTSRQPDPDPSATGQAWAKKQHRQRRPDRGKHLLEIGVRGGWWNTAFPEADSQQDLRLDK
jgi:predicted NBD/HSP70 family sugar kinase